MAIDTVDLEHVFGQVDPDAFKLHVWTPSRR
jgi:hypothetical protein